MYMEINDCRCKNSSDDNVVFYADNSDDNDLIVGENYCKFYDVVAKLQQGHEFWEERVSQSKCLNWSFRPDLNVPPSKRLPKIAPDLQAHNFGALSDRMDVLGKMFSNLNVHKVLCFLRDLK